MSSCQPLLLALSLLFPAHRDLPAKPTDRSSASAPKAESSPRSDAEMLRLARLAQSHGDPGLALSLWRALLVRHPEGAPQEVLLGIGETWRSIGQTAFAEAYARKAILEEPGDPRAWALLVRSKLRGGEFREALSISTEAVQSLGSSESKLLAAHASALYRNQKMRAAEGDYRRLLAKDPVHAEALIRLGSGLLPARPAPVGGALRRAVSLGRRGDFESAEAGLLKILKQDEDHPIALRILGDLLLTRERTQSPLKTSGILAKYWSLRAGGPPLPRVLSRFFPDLDHLSASRKELVRLSAAPFQEQLSRVAKRGGCHDLLMECERTTDGKERRWLKGKKTFDGRVWDDVRGMGGLHAATGIEALEEARDGGFQTLVHELAHQVHLYAMSDSDRRVVESLYRRAKEEGRCLDYYAASHVTEYFAQGVEAWFSYLKLAGQPVTHGHTHWELLRRDPALAAFIARVSESNPLEGPNAKAIFHLAFEAAIRAGRVEDARLLSERFLGGKGATERRRRLCRASIRFRTL